MSFFIAILALILIPFAIINAVHVARINHKLKSIAEKIESEQGEEKALLSSYIDKVNKMGFYRDAVDNVEDTDVKKLFKNLLADEERHIKVLEKVVLS